MFRIWPYFNKRYRNQLDVWHRKIKKSRRKRKIEIERYAERDEIRRRKDIKTNSDIFKIKRGREREREREK